MKVVGQRTYNDSIILTLYTNGHPFELLEIKIQDPHPDSNERVSILVSQIERQVVSSERFGF